MTSKIVVNNIEADAGVSTVTFVGDISVTGSAGALSAGSITVGDKFINSSGVGIGTTDTVGRNAGVGTAVGTLIYNTTTNKVEVYTAYGWFGGTLSASFSATGGTESTTSRSGYKVHTFTSPGSFIVNGIPGTVEYLVVAGGGGGGAGLDPSNIGNGGGGGAGGFRTGNLPVSPGTYTIQVGGGGASATISPRILSVSGTPSFITNPGITSITSFGGGAGGCYGTPGQNGLPGGSGGGSAYAGDPGYGLNPSTPEPVLSPFGLSSPYPITQGYNGGNDDTGGPLYGAGGGGGASAVGYNGLPGGPSGGGAGAPSSITGVSTNYAGGGGGGVGYGPYPAPTGGVGGGGNGGPSTTPGTAATANTGGGGGGGGNDGPPASPGFGGNGGNGGSGVVIIAYPTA